MEPWLRCERLRHMKLLAAAIFLACLAAACGGSEDSPPTHTPAVSAGETATPAITAFPEPSATPRLAPAATVPATSTPSPEPTLAPAATPTAAVSSVSGIEGVALIGPSCPVQQAGVPCPDKPWEGVVVVEDLAGREVTRTMSDAEGRFSIELPPGEYVLRTVIKGAVAAPVDAPVSVEAGQVAEVELRLDSGIR
jgi:hypothetical protein